MDKLINYTTIKKKNGKWSCLINGCCIYQSAPSKKFILKNGIKKLKLIYYSGNTNLFTKEIVKGIDIVVKKLKQKMHTNYLRPRHKVFYGSYSRVKTFSDYSYTNALLSGANVGVGYSSTSIAGHYNYHIFYNKID